MRLSFSTMRLLHECPHNYVNKMSGIPQPESEALIEGRRNHRIMQDHVSGRKLHEDFSHIDLKFPIVEVEDYDPRCKFEVPFRGHTIIGFIDGLDKPVQESPTVMLEGKFSSSPWSLTKFKKSAQRKIYGWAVPSLEKAFLITGHRKTDKWKVKRIKTAMVPFTEQDYEEAIEYMNFAIDKIKSGDLLTDLVGGKCTDPYCWWGENCMYK